MAVRVFTYHWLTVASLLTSSVVAASSLPAPPSDASPALIAKCRASITDQPLPTLRKCSDVLLARGDKQAAARALLLRAQRLMAQSQAPPAREVALDEADYALRQAAKLLPEAIEPLRQRCALAELRNDPNALERRAEQLIERAPHDPRGPRYRAVALLALDRIADARVALERARALGLDQKSYDALANQLGESPRFASKSVLSLVLFLMALCVLYLFRLRRRAKSS